MNMKKSWYSFFFLLFVSLSLSSWQSNPFDIKSRNNQDTTILDTIISEPVQQVPLENFQEKQDSSSIIDNNSVENTTESFLEKQQKKIISENPFNVSHIPIRKKLKVDPKPIKEVQQKEPESVVEKADNRDTIKSENEIDLGDLQDVPTNKFIFWLILFQLLILTSVLSLNREIVRKIYRSITNDNFAKLIARDYNNGFNAFFMILYLVFWFSFSTFVYLILRHFYEFDGIINFLYVLLSVFGIYFIRHTFLGFLSWTFPRQRSSTYYNFMVVIFNNFLGLLLIPINVAIAYAPHQLSLVALYVGITLTILAFLLRFLRGSFHAYGFIRQNLLHFFLYLCTCEIAPVVILVKVLTKLFFN